MPSGPAATALPHHGPPEVRTRHRRFQRDRYGDGHARNHRQPTALVWARCVLGRRTARTREERPGRSTPSDGDAAGCRSAAGVPRCVLRASVWPAGVVRPTENLSLPTQQGLTMKAARRRWAWRRAASVALPQACSASTTSHAPLQPCACGRGSGLWHGLSRAGAPRGCAGLNAAPTESGAAGLALPGRAEAADVLRRTHGRNACTNWNDTANT